MTDDRPFGRGAPLCAAPDPELRAPRCALPSGACDCHAHICGPADRYPYSPERIYTPPDALTASFAALLEELGVERAVLVQPSVYGSDNLAMLDALAGLGAGGMDCRAVAVIDDTISDDDLARMDAAGVRGIRFNLVDVADPASGPLLPALRHLCERIAPLGWHAEFLVHVDDIPDFDEQFADWPVEIVVGHMGYCNVGRTPDDPGFKAMVRLAASGRCWIKLTGPYRIAPGDMPYAEAGAFAAALAETVSDRLVWGTDWPHVMVTRPMPNDADLADLLATWIPDETVRRAICVDNPERLYGFGPFSRQEAP